MEIYIILGKEEPKSYHIYKPKFYDDMSLNMQEIDELLGKNILIYGADHYLVYYINNLIARYIATKDNDSIPDDLKDRLSLNPELVKIIQEDDNGNSTIIQDECGLLKGCYFDKYIKFLMDDFDNSINYFKDND